MAGKLDETLKGIDEAIGQLDDAVKEMGDTVNTARGQMSHVSLISGEAMEAIGQVKQQVFKLAEKLDNRRVLKAIALGFVFTIMLANVFRTILPVPGRKKKRQRRRP